MNKYSGRVVALIDDSTVVVNVGETSGIRLNQVYAVVGLGDDIVDPETNEVLEKLEILRGRTRVVHVQENISTLESIDSERLPGEPVARKSYATPTNALLRILQNPSGPTPLEAEAGPRRIRPLRGAKIGDMIIRVLSS